MAKTWIYAASAAAIGGALIGGRGCGDPCLWHVVSPFRERGAGAREKPLPALRQPVTFLPVR
ncbi:hypothetical protein, partial [Pseudomonas aeruginosa]|uniref:hypothetical protein n=1 Tax=Pseudomonas aeruginosa TaxID=287 RepID=UPI00129887F4